MIQRTCDASNGFGTRFTHPVPFPIPAQTRPPDTISYHGSVSQPGKTSWPYSHRNSSMADALALAASVIAIVQITKTTIDLVAEIYSIVQNQRVSCPEFDQFSERLEQVHKRAEELSQKDGSTIARNEYADVQQWLQKCRDFLVGLIQEGTIAKYLNSRKAATRFEKYHRMIDQCYTILGQRSIDRIEEQMGAYHITLVEKMCVYHGTSGPILAGSCF